MKFTNGGIKTLRNVDEASRNAELLIRGGYIDQLSSGVYSFLPLGYRVLRKVEQIIREEMDAIGGQEVLMPALLAREYWDKTDRYKVPVSFKTKGAGKSEYVLGWTHEEIITPIAKKQINSYKDLPLYLYQIQTKFRDEPRAKSGLLRTREFSMKDLYSFHVDQEDLDKYYEKAKKAYFNVFKRCGLAKDTVLTYASGGDFSKYSHEFQTICESGEDTIYLCEKCNVAVNKEIIHDQSACPECGNDKLVEKKAIEVGNIFKLGTRFSEAWDLKYQDKNGKENLVIMASYGIGPGRIMGTVIEKLADEKGIVWPEELTPYDIHLLNINGAEKEAEEIYQKLQESGYSVIWDNRDERAGVKLADSDLLGIKTRIVISPKTVEAKKIEIKERNKNKEELISLADFIKRK